MKKLLIITLLVLLAHTPQACATPAQVVVSKNTMSWVAPTAYVNGDPLTDLMGYYAYCSDTTGVFSNTKRIQISGSSQLSVDLRTIPDITDADVYCAVTAYTPEGESGYAIPSGLRVIGNDGKLPNSATGAAVE